MGAMVAAGTVAQAASAVGDAIEASQEQDPAMQAALAMSAQVGAAQLATDAAAIAAGLVMGKDPCVPPGTPGMITQGSPNVLIVSCTAQRSHRHPSLGSR